MLRSLLHRGSTQVVHRIVRDEVKTSARWCAPARGHRGCIGDLPRRHVINPLEQSTRGCIVFEAGEEAPLILDPNQVAVLVEPLHPRIAGARPILRRGDGRPSRRLLLHRKGTSEKGVVIGGLRRVRSTADVALVTDILPQGIDSFAPHRPRGVLELPHLGLSSRTALLDLLVSQVIQDSPIGQIRCRIVLLDPDQARRTVQRHQPNRTLVNAGHRLGSRLLEDSTLRVVVDIVIPLVGAARLLEHLQHHLSRVVRIHRLRAAVRKRFRSLSSPEVIAATAARGWIGPIAISV